ncbi:MAG: hypothetical protein ACRYFS_09045 [Janthinobacterium lividum]
MRDAQNVEIDQAKAALHLASAYHAGALLAARHRPDDPQIHRRLQEAVQDGRDAWKAFQMAAPLGQASQIKNSVPSEFQQ